jgi:hypothetical protein
MASARIIVLSLTIGVLGAGFGFVIFRQKVRGIWQGLWSYEKGAVMAFARIIVLSLTIGVLGAGFAFVIFRQYGDPLLMMSVFACAGCLVGAIAGAAQEIVTAQHRRRDAE